MVKRIEEYADAELEGLTTEEVEKIIDLECVEEGVRLLPPIPVPPQRPNITPDVQAFLVVGSLHVDTEKEAQEICDYLNRRNGKSAYHLEGIYAYSGPMGLEPHGEIEYQRRTFFSSAYYEEHKAALKDYAEAEKVYQSQKDDYRAAERSRSKVSEYVWMKVNRARKIATERAEYIAEHEQYKGIVGDPEKAFQCMVKAGRVSDEIFYREMLGLPAAKAPDELEETPEA